MPPPQSMLSLRPLRRDDSRVTKPKHKTAASKAKPARPEEPTLDRPLRFTAFPAEIQQMIWREAIKGPSCHHFKIHRDVDPLCENRWVIHLREKQKKFDTSAYRQWKNLFQVRDRAFMAAFRFHNRDSHIQPIALHRPRHFPAYEASAAIDVPNDLVILDFERGATHPGFTWFEHMDPYPGSAMNIRYIQMRLQHFRKVAIHYKQKFANALLPGPFACYCPPGNPVCGDFKACPHELACFLDCFRNLEAFYFVVEPRVKAHHHFIADYKKKISDKGYKGACGVKKGGRIVVAEGDLARFFDTNTEFLEHPSPLLLTHLGINEPSPFQNPRSCIQAALNIYKSKTGNEPFRRPLAQRRQVKFGLLIPYELEPKKPAAKS